MTYRTRELVFTAKTLIILKRAKRKLIKGWIFDSTKNTNLTPLEKQSKDFDQGVHEIYYLLPSERR